MSNLKEEQQIEIQEKDENCRIMKIQKELNDANEIN